MVCVCVLCVCVCVLLVRHTCVCERLPRSVMQKLVATREEVPLWNAVHCTEAAFKKVTGEDWPQDSDPRIQLRTFQDGSQRKVFTVTDGIPGARRETFKFSTTECINVPKDPGTLVFRDVKAQQHDLWTKRANSSWNVFTAATASSPLALRFPEINTYAFQNALNMGLVPSGDAPPSAAAVGSASGMKTPTGAEIMKTPIKAAGDAFSVLACTPPLEVPLHIQPRLLQLPWRL